MDTDPNPLESGHIEPKGPINKFRSSHFYHQLDVSQTDKFVFRLENGNFRPRSSRKSRRFPQFKCHGPSQPSRHHPVHKHKVVLKQQPPIRTCSARSERHDIRQNQSGWRDWRESVRFPGPILHCHPVCTDNSERACDCYVTPLFSGQICQ